MINLTRPTLLLDKKKCIENIERMAEKAGRHKLRFRPHYKTHQSAVIGSWFRDYGIEAITVSSVRMACYFASNGWNDITIAFPFNLLEMDEVNAIDPAVRINLEVVDAVTAVFIAGAASRPFGICIEIDTGYHRTGLQPEDNSEVNDILEIIQSCTLLHFAGLLTHAGQSYTARSREQVIRIHHASIRKLLDLSALVSPPGVALSIGDTPCCSIAEDFQGISEIRPGNFVFYDIMQQQIGSCSFDQIAVALACPVVAIHPERNEVLVHGGAVHLSKEHLTDEQGRKIYGYVAALSIHGWGPPIPEAYVKDLSQEHGVIHVPHGMLHLVKPGQLLCILPVHSCLTADAMGVLVTLEGERIELMGKR